jgi:hypothetical protein
MYFRTEELRGTLKVISRHDLSSDTRYDLSGLLLNLSSINRRETLVVV